MRAVVTLIALTLSTLTAPQTPPRPVDHSRPAPAAVVADRYARTLAYATAVDRAKRHADYARLLRYAAAIHRARSYPAGQCGGTLPPCSVMRCESGGNIRAENPHSSASGKWQVLSSTWRYAARSVPSARPYSRASHAPERVQDDVARYLWAGGRGRSQWICR